MDCLFCKIVAGQIPADVAYQDDEFLAFRDIHPQAPMHVLIVPRSHIGALTDLTRKDEGMIGRLILAAKAVAEKEGLSQKGYRLSLNCGPEGGQVVPHLHLHLLGGRKLDDQLG
ncbi:MAG: histidine triad nucleotide-binding protein [Chloroflexi bacterium]|nr:histidine triad nucleotide-binding protein [Chloroflexota bacterium]